MSDTVTKSLVEKLSEACDAVGGVEKKGRNETQNYAYVKAADVAKAIRHELFSRGVMILPHEHKPEWREFQTMKGTTMRECILQVTYRITDGSSEMFMSAYGVSMDTGDKAIYKAKTGALKYFLRGLGLIPDEKDDPEMDEPLVDKKAETAYKKEFAKQTADQHRKITPAEAKVFWAAVKKGGKTEQQVRDRFRTMKIAGTEHMLYTDYEAELKWAAGMETDLTDTLKRSVASVDAPESDKHNFRKLFALAEKNNVPKDDVRKVGYEIYKVSSLNDLTPDQFSALVEWVESKAESA